MIPMIYQGGGHWRCEGYHARRCDKLYGQGEEVMFDQIEDRSPQSHKFYFARIKELWEHLPEWMEDEFANPEELRKKALVDAGYYIESKFVFRTNEDALRAATFMAELGTWLYFSINAHVLVVRKPKSQSMKAMRKKMFEQSKNDVLDTIERLIRREPPKDNVVHFGQKET